MRRALFVSILLALACSSDGFAPIFGDEFATVSAGLVHSCGTDGMGAGYCWGGNTGGEIGIGDTAFFKGTASPVAGKLVFARIEAGIFHTCGITRDGTAYCWGDGGLGQLGADTVTVSRVPVPVSGGLAFKQITVGDGFACGLTTAGAAYCWGDNYNGQLGRDTTSVRTPIPVSGGHVFTAITAARFHTCAIDTARDAYCWGINDRGVGQLGIGDTGKRTTPTLVAGGLKFWKIDGGGQHTCGLTTTGAAYCWGSGDRGQLGNGTQDSLMVPFPVVGDHSFVAISAGSSHTCALEVNGQLYCWGSNGKGQLGATATSACGVLCSLIPLAAAAGHSFQEVSAGVSHTCAIARGGGALCWGNNNLGQVGNGSFSDSVGTPTVVQKP